MPELTQHPFIKKYAFGGGSSEPIPEEALQRLQRVGDRSKATKAILTDLADRLNFTEMQEMNKAFMAMDADNDGVITADELRNALNKSIASEEIEKIVANLIEEDGTLSYTAFMGLMLSSKAADEAQLLRREFNKLDADGTGCLDKNEVAGLLERPHLADILRSKRRGTVELMKMLDENGDGKVDFNEFKAALSGEAGEEVVEVEVQKACCPKGHRLSRVYVSGWLCDGANEFPGGCKSGISHASQTAGMVSFRCTLCNYDLCERCYNFKAATGKPSASVTRAPFTKGQRVEYLSTTVNRWVQAQVTDVQPGSGAIMLDCKPGYWMPVEQQDQKVRLPTGASDAVSAAPGAGGGGYSAGQDVEYNSVSSGGYIAAKVTAVGPAGELQLDVKPGYWFRPEEAAMKIRMPRARPAGPARARTEEPPRKAAVVQEPEARRRSEERRKTERPARPAEPAGLPREQCRYGAGCWQKSPAHRERFCHPGDRDWIPSTTS